MKNAIVTGASGFIGTHLCKELARRGVQVYAFVHNFDDRKECLKHNNIYLIQVSLSDYSKITKIDMLPEEIDVFYHLAWDGTSGSILADSQKQIANIQYTCEALEMAKRLNCKKFILAGTINELELPQFFHSENNKPRISCIYGTAKLAADFMCKALATKIDINYNTAIIGSCFGEGDYSRRIHNTIIHNLLNNVKPTLISGETLHDWVYVDDVARLFCAIGEKSINLKNYYLGHRKLKRLSDIVEEVKHILGVDMDIEFGTIHNNFFIDYSLVDLDAVYLDTGEESNIPFDVAINNTAHWVKKIFD